MDKVSCLKDLLSCLTGKENVNGETICEVLTEFCKEMDGLNVYEDGVEVDTHKKWIDGKPIYRLAVKTTLGNLAAEINKHLPKTIVSFYGQSVSTYGNQMPIPSAVALSGQYKMDFLQSNSTFDVAFQYGEYFHDDYDAYCVIEYTKRG